LIIPHFINLYEPADYQYKGAGESIPVTIEDNTPFARLKIVQPENAVAEGKFLIDTGANSVLNVFGDFDKAHHLSTSLPKVLQSRNVGANGKAAPASDASTKFSLGAL
jgi:hypothetical protein